MSKKVLSFLLLLTLVLGSVSTVFATETDLKIVDSVIVEDPIINNEDTEGTIISGNTAHKEGSVIYLGDSKQLDNLSATKDVIFSENKAAEGYFMIGPADIALHNQKIITTSFTEPFTYGYNNFDISYTKDDRLRPVTVNYFIKMSDTTPLASVTGYARQTMGVLDTSTDPIMENLVFIGWADENHVFYNADSVVTDNLNLYAVWKLR